jgi:aspartyl-tRNA(Asn)/glutamyl-tRNA(Gln) amidotransferase subunit C
MAPTPDDIVRIAKLARLKLTPEEKTSMRTQLNGFLSIAQQMGQVDTTGIAPLYTPLSALGSVALRLRDDAVTESDTRTLNQRSAPKVEDGLYLVPKVMAGS